MRVSLHLGEHKSLTVLLQRTMNLVSRATVSERIFYVHVRSDVEAAKALLRVMGGKSHSLSVIGLNNTYVSKDEISSMFSDSSLVDVRRTAIVREPMSSLKSSYQYHRDGGEPWCNEFPISEETIVRLNLNREVCGQLRTSLAETYSGLSLHDGMQLECGLRSLHFASKERILGDAEIRVFSYDGFLQNPTRAFGQLATEWGLGRSATSIGKNSLRVLTSKVFRNLTSHVQTTDSTLASEEFPRLRRSIADKFPLTDEFFKAK